MKLMNFELRLCGAFGEYAWEHGKLMGPQRALPLGTENQMTALASECNTRLNRDRGGYDPKADEATKRGLDFLELGTGIYIRMIAKGQVKDKPSKLLTFLANNEDPAREVKSFLGRLDVYRCLCLLPVPISILHDDFNPLPALRDLPPKGPRSGPRGS